MPSTLRTIFIVLIVVMSGAASPGRVAAQSAEKRWVVLFHQQSTLPNGAAATIARAGGVLVASLPEVGAMVATGQPGFDTRVAADPSVAYVAEDVPVRMIAPRGMSALDPSAAGDGPVEPTGSDAQTGTEPFYRFQWDKKRMRASDQGSYSVERGRRDVVVAVLDTGAEAAHPDIAPNLDAVRSRSFVPVAANPDGDANPAAWDDKNGHGTFCLSTVGAPINGIGMSGVAPNVTLVALKVLGDNGQGSYVSIAQALIYAGVHRFDIASMSIGGYLRRADQQQHALIHLLQRAVNFARASGVTPIAALSNESFNVSDGDFFRDYMVLPAEIDGVIGVSATGYFDLKASYSNYGVGKTDVSAPGGDYAVQATTTLVGGGSVLGAYAPDNPDLPGATYVFASGTSMAAPNAAGVAALIISRYGDFSGGNGRKLHMSPQAVESLLQQTANNQACPDPATVTYFLISPPFPANTPAPGTEPNQRCQGNAGYNNFFGKGIVDALKAVTTK